MNGILTMESWIIKLLNQRLKHSLLVALVFVQFPLVSIATPTESQSLIEFDERWYLKTTSSDPGTAWLEPGFEITDRWLLFTLPMGLRDSPDPTPVPIRTTISASNQKAAYYCKKAVFIEGEIPALAELDFTMMLEDGAVIYLNGSELIRIRMPEGTVNFETLAAHAVGIPTIERFSVRTDLLVPGTNWIAVEAHVADKMTSQIVFGTELALGEAAPLEFNEHPQDVVATEFDTVRLSAQVTRGVVAYQWHVVRDGATNAINGERTRHLELDDVMLNDSGSYFVTASNVFGIVPSSAATVSILPNSDPYELISASGSLEPTQIILSFNRQPSMISATNPENYSITNTLGGLLTIHEITVEGTNIHLRTEPRIYENNYVLTASGITDRAATPNPIQETRLAVTALVQLVELDSTWDIYDPIFGLDPEELSDPDWREEIDYKFGDAYWLNGAGPFLHDGGGQSWPFMENTGLYETRYLRANFRHVFYSQLNPTETTLRLRTLMDDGGIVYLNGQEIYRQNLPPGIIQTNTPTESIVRRPTFTTVDLSAEHLRYGNNLLAVELHQAERRDVDKALAIELLAAVDTFPIGPAVITMQPEDVSVNEGQNATFRVSWRGSGTPQWYVNGEEVSGATNLSYVIHQAVPSMNGARITARIGDTQFTREAILTVAADLIPPDIAHAQYDLHELTVDFSEAVDSETALTLENYALTNCNGSSRTLLSVQLLDSNSVVLTVDGGIEIDDVLVMREVKDLAETPNSPEAPVGRSVTISGTVISMGSIWKFDQSGVDRGISWREPSYDDELWREGPGLLGVESAALGAPLRTPLTLGQYTYYFRHGFDATGIPAGVAMEISYFVDDAAVFYLNGQEVHRTRITGFPTYTTTASTAVGNASLEGPFTINLNSALLTNGMNVLAVEVHQTSLSSSDIVFGAQLTVSSLPSVGMFVANHSRLDLRIERSPEGGVTLSWPTALEPIVLERAARFSGPWRPFPGSITAPPNQTYFLGTLSGTRYFRLRSLATGPSCWQRIE